MTCDLDKYAFFVVTGSVLLGCSAMVKVRVRAGARSRVPTVCYRCIRLWRATWRDSVERGHRLIFNNPSHPPIVFSYITLILESLSIYHSVCLPLPFSNDTRALSFRSVDALTLISVINWQELLHSLCHPLWSSSTLPLSLILPIFFLAYPFIKHWLPFLICILLISSCQLTLVIPFDFIASFFTPSFFHSHLLQILCDHSASMNL